MELDKLMVKKFLSVGATLSLIMSAGPAWAIPTFVPMTLETPGTSGTLILPVQADNSPVISLGTGMDPATGKLVEGYAFIHYKDQAAKPEGKPGKGGTKCYGFLAKDTKWKILETWVVNTTNTRGLAEASVLSILDGGISKWEDAADGTVGNSAIIDILGSGSTTSDALAADTVSPDNQNEVYFADISSAGAIAVTIVWGIFSGPPWMRELVEWDQVYDDVDYDWSLSGESGKMDFDNIATHELGHSVGMADIYSTDCSEVTMYGYADYGETKKRDLEPADVTGVSSLY
jgi:hypothetical protein